MTSLRPDRPAAIEGWTTQDWTYWLASTGALHSIRPDDQLCSLCAAPVGQTYSGTPYIHCWTCRDRYANFLDRVIPISFSASGGLTALLAQAKNEPDRFWVRIGVASLLSTFMTFHLTCLEAAAGGPFDFVISIPSHISRRNGVDHLRLIRASVTGPAAFGGRPWQTDLLTKTTAVNADTRRREVDPNLFVVNPAYQVAGKRVLLIDDLYTSGHTLASAGAALVRAGALRPSAISVGRQIRAGDRETDAFLERTNRLQGRGLDLRTCRVHRSA